LNHNPSKEEKNMAAKKPNILIIWGDDIGWFASAETENNLKG
jgi:hypothetical protein